MRTYGKLREKIKAYGAEKAAKETELDTATLDRVSSKKYELCRELIKIDHHIPVEDYGVINWVEEERSSTCEMIVAFYDAFRDTLKINREAATYLYTGMVTDSGRFRFRSVSGDTMRAAAAMLEAGVDTDRLYANLYIDDFDQLKFKAHVYNKMKITEKAFNSSCLMIFDRI